MDFIVAVNASGFNWTAQVKTALLHAKYCAVPVLLGQWLCRRGGECALWRCKYRLEVVGVDWSRSECSIARRSLRAMLVAEAEWPLDGVKAM